MITQGMFEQKSAEYLIKHDTLMLYKAFPMSFCPKSKYKSLLLKEMQMFFLHSINVCTCVCV